jgi:serine/threonine-protein kinase SRPK3
MATLDVNHSSRLRHFPSRSHSSLRMSESTRTGLLHRSRSHLQDYRQGLTQLFQPRSNAPGQPDIISSAKPIEEETQPKYDPTKFYPAKIGEILNDRYKLVAKLGYGMTATVWLAKDLQVWSQNQPSSPTSPTSRTPPKKYVTIKININSLSTEFQTGRRKIAEKLVSGNPDHPGYNHIRFMLSTFKIKSRWGEHLCIVYDVLREPINICMEKWQSRLFSSERLRTILPSLLKGLDYMHSECHIVHTDLKADNIMMGMGDLEVLDKFVLHEYEHPSPRKMPDHHGRIVYQSCSDFGAAPTEEIIRTAKITDIGLAEWGDEPQHKPIQSNAFTCPEVILQAGWSYPADIWNLGVMMWDLIETVGLFDAIDTRPGKYNSAQHLGLMIALLGPPPKELLDRGNATATYFDEDGEFRKPEHVMRDLTWECSITRMRGEEKELFIDFAKKMICWLPEERWTAKQLLEHPFLTKAESEFQFSRVESRADIHASLNLVNEFATTKPRSSTATPLQSNTPSTHTPSRTPNRTPEPSIKNLSVRGRIPTDLSDLSTKSMPTSFPRMGDASVTSESAAHANSNKTSQDLIDSILGHKKMKSVSHPADNQAFVGPEGAKVERREDGSATSKPLREPTARDLRCYGEGT